MKVKLIPVIEITHYDQGVELPKYRPYYEYPNEWEEYNRQCLDKAGFPNKMSSYTKGCAFYKLEDISDANLVLEMKNWIEGYGREEITSFYGGYILNIDSVDMLFPQCCGDLSDIRCWRNLAKGKGEFYCQGHPGPDVNIRKGIITFDLTVKETHEHFVPLPPQTIFQLLVEDLANAVALVEEELNIFSDRLEKINVKNNFNLDRIGDLLIFGENT